MSGTDRVDWICLSADDYWNSNPHSRYHIAKEFSKHGKVLWVNSIGHRFPSIKRRKGWQLIFRKIKSYLIFFRKAETYFYVVSPLTIPVFRGAFVRRLNVLLLWWQIKFTAKIAGIRGRNYFISSPSFGILAEKLANAMVVYYYSDLYTVFRELKYKQEVEVLDRKLFSAASLVYGASEEICSRVSTTEKRAKYLPHAVDVNHFARTGETPLSMEGIPSPVIGYYGTITDSNDWEIIEYCAKERPSYHFVFIGKKFISLPHLESLPNIHFIDKVSYNDIPLYGQSFDVAIMFWVLRDWIKNSNPLKLLEYFALGKPVVSVDIPEVRKRFGDIVSIAANKEEFLQHIDSALRCDRMQLRRVYEQVLQNYSWTNVASEIYADMKGTGRV